MLQQPMFFPTFGIAVSVFFISGRNSWTNIVYKTDLWLFPLRFKNKHKYLRMSWFQFHILCWFQILGRLQSFIGPPNRWSPFHECLCILGNFSIACKSSQISTNTRLYWRMQCLFLNKVKRIRGFLTIPPWSITTCHLLVHIMCFWWPFLELIKFYLFGCRSYTRRKCYNLVPNSIYS